MSITADDGVFVRRTHATLSDLAAEAGLIVRNLHARPMCPDSAACRQCEALRLIHERIDDHLNQLDEAAR